MPVIIEQGEFGKRSVNISREDVEKGVADGTIEKVFGRTYKRVYNTKIVQSDLEAEGGKAESPKAPKTPPEPAKESEAKAPATQTAAAPAKAPAATETAPKEAKPATPTPVAPKPTSAVASPKSTEAKPSTPTPKKS